ncbi:O-antigen ligase [Knoellia sp. p5-6-4]|uniref:O-antigen ligase family protein n=1 Tax=unclassified Knoellia TaxID=2618719 RepID=UPI0023D9C0AF|nr:O-antigen ligase family protein [Knoellia sp. p5-6-4]MDF2144473.1 O-antigen ligase family protein [Knoellia sp. p5-6-4]
MFVLVGAGLAGDTTFLDGDVYFRAAVVICFVAIFVLPFGTRALPPATKRALALACLLLWAWLAVVDLLAADLQAGQLVAPLTSLVVLVLSGVMSAPLGMTPRVLGRTLLTVLAVVGVASALLPASWRACDEFKCGPAGALMTGPFPSENYLAMQAVLVLAWVLLGLRGSLRVTAVLLVATLLLASGSRTSMIVALLALLLFVVSGRERHTTGPRRPVSYVTASLLGMLAVVVGYVLIVRSTTSTFSNRGQTWARAVEAVEEHPWRGLGFHSWFELQRVGTLPDHFAHSEYLILLFSGGYVALALFAVVIAVAVRQTAAMSPGPLARAALPVFVFAGLGLTESVWNPFTFDGSSWPILVMLLVTGRPRVDSRPRAERAATAA